MTEIIPEQFKPQPCRASFTFVQDGNTMGTTEKFETLTVELETQLPGEDPFIVLKTTGWSIDDMEDLTELVNKCLDAYPGLDKLTPRVS